MIKRLAQIFCAAAGSHMKTVSDKAGLERVPRHAADVSGAARPFESMQQNRMAERLSPRSLRFDEHLSILVCPNEPLRDRVVREVVTSRPEVTQNGKNVRIAKKRFERPHAAESNLLSQSADYAAFLACLPAIAWA